MRLKFNLLKEKEPKKVSLDFHIPLSKREFINDCENIFKKNDCIFDRKILSGRYKTRKALPV